jgi:hypothetical protein
MGTFHCLARDGRNSFHRCRFYLQQLRTSHGGSSFTCRWPLESGAA